MSNKTNAEKFWSAAVGDNRVIVDLAKQALTDCDTELAALRQQLAEAEKDTEVLRKGFCVALSLFANTLESEDMPEKIFDFLQWTLTAPMFQSSVPLDVILYPAIDVAIAAGRKL